MAWSSPCRPLPSPVSTRSLLAAGGELRGGWAAALGWGMASPLALRRTCPALLAPCCTGRACGTAHLSAVLQDHLRYLEADESRSLHPQSVLLFSACPSQDDLRYLEADESKNLDFLGGGGQPPPDGLEHFPQLWCPNGTYSAHGQVFLVPLSQVRQGGAAAAVRLCISSAPGTGAAAGFEGQRRRLSGAANAARPDPPPIHRGCSAAARQPAWPPQPTHNGPASLPFLASLPCFPAVPQALRLIMHQGEPLPEARPSWEFPLGATLPFFVLTFAIMCYTNGVGASTGEGMGGPRVRLGMEPWSSVGAPVGCGVVGPGWQAAARGMGWHASSTICGISLNR